MSAPPSYNWLLAGLSNLVQFGVGGPKLKNLLGVLQARNAADSAFANVSGATPTIPDHLTTKFYVDAAIAAISGAQTVFFPFTFADFPGTVSSVTSIPAAALIIASYVNVTGVFDATGTPLIDLGRTGIPDHLFSSAPPPQIDLTQVGIQGGPFALLWGSPDTVLATLTGTPGFGTGTISVSYVLPQP